jgi:hypothetical protein
MEIPIGYERVYQNIALFLQKVTVDDLAGLVTPVEDRVQYRHSHKGIKRKGGKPPKDYLAVEVLTDLRQHFQRGELDEALPLYYQLKRLMGL